MVTPVKKLSDQVMSKVILLIFAAVAARIDQWSWSCVSQPWSPPLLRKVPFNWARVPNFLISSGNPDGSLISSGIGDLYVRPHDANRHSVILKGREGGVAPPLQMFPDISSGPFQCYRHRRSPHYHFVNLRSSIREL